MLTVFNLCLFWFQRTTGPSKCVAWTFYQPGGKVQGGRPALMSFIRNRLPECCPVRALFAHLAHRWAVKGEPMPEPGTEEWSKLMLFLAGAVRRSR